ncbi:MAG TPA: polyprenol monophosphomannose synthase [Acidimicrobiales bacterium]|jgi:dolichol-phosphate mannosyltransferase
MGSLIVLPTYQEGGNVAAVLRRIRAAVPGAHILVVDDGSPDGTAELAEAVGAEFGAIDVMRRDHKQGLGSAYRDGMRWGLARGYDILVEMDADLSHDPADLPRLIGAVEDGAALALGSRYVAGGSIPAWSLARRILSREGNRYAGALLGLPVSDATSGFRAYRAAALAAVDLDQVRAEGYGFQIEMVYRVAALGGPVVELPISFTERTLGHSKMSARIVIEAFALVTWWALRDRVRGQHPPTASV